jgi:hypothetical protein
MRCYMVQTDSRGEAEVRFTAEDDETRAMTRGDRIVFYQLRGDAGAERGLFVAWGEVDRLNAEDGEGVAHLRSVTTLKRPVPFSDLRADPRRGRTAPVQPVSAEVFNLVLSRSRR